MEARRLCYIVALAISTTRLAIAVDTLEPLAVRGKVVDPDGEPVFGAVVRIRNDRSMRRDLERTTKTDDEGRFEFASFPRNLKLPGIPGVMVRQIEIQHSDRKLRASVTVPEERLAAAEQVLDLEQVVLHNTGRIAGTVLGDGKPLAGVLVTGQELFANVREQTKTDKDGRFEFESVESGKHVSLWARHEGYTDQGTTSYLIEAGKTIEVPPIELKSRGAFVAGVVVDLDGNPVAGVTVSAWEHSGRPISFGRNGAPAPTDAQGKFRINDLPNVPLKLLAYIQPPEPQRDRSTNFPATAAAEPNQADVRIVLDPKLQRPLP